MSTIDCDFLFNSKPDAFHGYIALRIVKNSLASSCVMGLESILVELNFNSRCSLIHAAPCCDIMLANFANVVFKFRRMLSDDEDCFVLHLVVVAVSLDSCFNVVLSLSTGLLWMVLVRIEK